MKLGLFFVVVLGLLAALAAAVLVQAVIAPKRAVNLPQEQDVQVLVAGRSLPAMTVVDNSAVVLKKVQRTAIPQGALVDPVQVVGRVLVGPIVEGEAFKESHFAREGQGLNLATALPTGKRAFSLLLTDHTGMVGLLYPGSVVDVMVSVTAKRSGETGETVTRTLLQGVQVLAIGQESVASEPAARKTGAGTSASAKGDQRMVTLLVDPKQAQALQLASQAGTVSLSMRNPLDQQREEMQVTRVGDLAGIMRWDTAKITTAASSLLGGVLANITLRPAQLSAAPAKADPAKAVAPPAPRWETLIIRGAKTEVRTFALPEKKPATPTSAEIPAAAGG